MQAIPLREYGGPEVLRVEEVPDPEPLPGEVVVELRAAALNRHDTLYRRGLRDLRLPFILGSDGAGVRRDTGEEVVICPSLAWGDDEAAPGPDFRILGGPDDGTYAELVKVPEENIFPKPRHLSFDEAAALPVCGLTAYRALFTRAGLRAGETVLVLGAGSGVAALAVPLARAAGARVLVTSSSADKLERAREHGADAGIDYTAADWVAEIRALTGDAGVDVVVDSVGSTVPDSLRSLRPGGRVVVFGTTGGMPTIPLELRPFYFAHQTLLGTAVGSPRDFSALLEAVERGRLRPAIDSVRPLANAPEAHARLESGEHFGKLVLAIA